MPFGAAAFFALVLLGVLFTMRTTDGTLVVEISDPDVTLQVLDAQGKLLVEQKARVADIPEKVEISVVPGQGKLRVVKNGVELLTKEFTLLSGGRETMKARLKRLGNRNLKSQDQRSQIQISNPQQPQSSIPPLAVAPFHEAKAKQHQEAWARYLGAPVEMTNSIGMKLVFVPSGTVHDGQPRR